MWSVHRQCESAMGAYVQLHCKERASKALRTFEVTSMEHNVTLSEGHIHDTTSARGLFAKIPNIAFFERWIPSTYSSRGWCWKNISLCFVILSFAFVAFYLRKGSTVNLSVEYEHKLFFAQSGVHCSSLCPTLDHPRIFYDKKTAAGSKEKYKFQIH